MTEFYTAYPDNGHDQHKNELHVIHFMEHHLGVNNKQLHIYYIHLFIVYNTLKFHYMILVRFLLS